MRLALSTFLFYEMSRSYAIREIAKLGFSRFELSHPLDLSDAEAEELNALQAEHGVVVSSVHIPGRRATHPAGMAAYERFVDFAAGIGAECVVTHVDEEQLEARGDAYLRDIVGVARRTAQVGLTYTVENSREPLTDLERVLDASPDIRFTLDVQHAAHHPAERDPWVYFDKFGERLANIHVLAATRRIEGLGHGVPPGFELEDEFDWSRMAAALRALRYAGPITIEHNLGSLTRVLMTYLPMLRKALDKRAEMGIMPLHTDFGSRGLPGELRGMDTASLRLVYDPDAGSDSCETTLEHALASYSKSFFEEVFSLPAE